MASVKVHGDLRKTEMFFHKLLNRQYLKVLSRYGKLGVEALAGATPKKSGKTAASWGYRIEEADGYTAIVFEIPILTKTLILLLYYRQGMVLETVVTSEGEII